MTNKALALALVFLSAPAFPATVSVGAQSTTTTPAQDAVLLRYKSIENARRAAQNPPLPALNNAEALILLATKCLDELKNRYQQDKREGFVSNFERQEQPEREATCAAMTPPIAAENCP